MRKRLRSQRGVILVQVMVLAMVMGTIAAMLIQLQFSRYVTTYRVENFARSRTIVMAAFNKKISDMIPTTSAGNWSAAISIVNPVFGTCTVSFTKPCSSFDASPPAGSEAVCVRFDPCNCTASPCS